MGNLCSRPDADQGFADLHVCAEQHVKTAFKQVRGASPGAQLARAAWTDTSQRKRSKGACYVLCRPALGPVQAKSDTLQVHAQPQLQDAAGAQHSSSQHSQQAGYAGAGKDWIGPEKHLLDITAGPSDRQRR